MEDYAKKNSTARKRKFARQSSAVADSSNFGSFVHEAVHDDETEITPAQDNKVKAFIFMNLFGAGATGQAIIFKIAVLLTGTY